MKSRKSGLMTYLMFMISLIQTAGHKNGSTHCHIFAALNDSTHGHIFAALNDGAHDHIFAALNDGTHGHIFEALNGSTQGHILCNFKCQFL